MCACVWKESLPIWKDLELKPLKVANGYSFPLQSWFEIKNKTMGVLSRREIT